MKRKLTVGTAWKLYINTINEAAELMLALKNASDSYPQIESFLFPAAAYIPMASELLSGSSLGYGFQNICHEPEGSYTGENSAKLLKAFGGKYAEIGHAERRKLFHETNTDINLKVRLCHRLDITPVICIGETEENITKSQNLISLKSQICWAFNEVPDDIFKTAILVYEPVWAIGKSSPARPEYIQSVHAFIRECVNNEYGKSAGDSLRIIYGGSNTPDTCSDILSLPDVDGLFVGRSALKADNFRFILNTASEIYKTKEKD